MKIRPRTKRWKIKGSRYQLLLGTFELDWYLQIFRGRQHVATKRLRAVDIYEITQHVLAVTPRSLLHPMTVLKSVVQLIPTVNPWPTRKLPPKLPRVRDPKIPQ